jgi:putative membrane protein
MPSEWQRLHGFTVVSRSLTLARQLLLPAILGGASAGDDFTSALQWIAVILAVPSIAIAAAQWAVFRYRLEGDELIIQSGVLSKRRRVIPLTRIQNIDLEQSGLERLFGMARLRMETASGGGQTEASLAVLTRDDARGLRSELMRRRDMRREADHEAEREAVEEPEAEARRLLRLSVYDLAIAGATSNEAGLLAAGLATGFELADDLGGLEQVGAWVETAFARGAALGLVGALAVGAGLAVAVLVVGWVLSIGVSIIRYHGFTLSRTESEIRREYGLLSRHQSAVPLERVQAVRIEESLLRRPLGLVALKIETAGSGPAQRQADRRDDAFVPIARRKEVGPLLREVFPDARFEDVSLTSVSPLARRRTFLRLAVPVVLGAAAAGLLAGPPWFALALLLLPAWLYAVADFRARGWARPGRYALVRGGVFTRVSWVVPERKIQTLHLRETPFQRRLDLATLLVDTAGSRAAQVADLEETTARPLLAALARDAESARRAVNPSPAAR